MTIPQSLGFDIPSTWTWATLEEATTKIGSGSTPRGGSSVYVESGTSLIRSQNVYDHQFKSEGLVFLNEESAFALRGVAVEPGDVLINITGDSILRTALVPENVLPARVNQHVAIIRSNGQVEPRFLQKWLSMPLMKDYMLGHSSGGTRKAITKRHLQSFPIALPPLGVQRAIAATLGALDDKIESNRKLASGVSDLVDTLALDLIDRVSTEILPLGQLVKFNQLAKKPFSTDAVRYVDIASVSSGRIDKVQELAWDEAPSRARRGVSDGDVIYSTVRPGKRAFALIIDPRPDIVVSTGFAVMSPSERLGSSMLAAVVGSPAFASYLESVVQGSAYPAVNIQAIGDYPVVVPKDVTVAEQFESRTMPLRRRATQAQVESERLVELRDTLLPELLSGRLRTSVMS